MTRFLGKKYQYRDAVIGVCMTLNEGMYMIGLVKPSGSMRRVKTLPLFLRKDEAELALQLFANIRKLREVQ